MSVRLDLSMPQSDLNFLQNFLHLQRIQRDPADSKNVSEVLSSSGSAGNQHAQSLAPQRRGFSLKTPWAPRLDAARKERFSFYLCSFEAPRLRRTA
jgi:hypothetical protein